MYLLVYYYFELLALESKSIKTVYHVSYNIGLRVFSHMLKVTTILVLGINQML